MNRQNRRPITIATAAAALCAALGVAACSDPASDHSAETHAPVVEEPVAPVEEAPPAPTAETPPPSDSTALPPDTRSSEESVRPESETLFY